MNAYKEGDIAKCIMKFGDSPSEWTGKSVVILSRIDHEYISPFLEESDTKKIANVTYNQYNEKAASEVRYKVMVGKRIAFMNHACFIDSKYWKFGVSEHSLIY